jgi:glycosyltransferase involved in cell wall biosynthesis
MKANPASEIIHFGHPWRSDVPEFSWSPEEAAGIVEKLSEEDRPLISVCVALKNRSRIPSEAEILELFPNCVRALARIHEVVGPIELVVADFHSDDWPLAEWLEKEAGAMKVHRLEMDGPFSRGRGMNAAVEAAQSSHILIYDADMVMYETAFITALSILADGEEGTAFFPIIQNLDPSGKADDWYEASFGMVFLPKKTFVAAEGIPEFQNWGGEDEILYEKVAQISRVERFKLAGLNHQWHPVSCRHLHYQGESHQDYRRYQAQRKREPGADFH